MSENFIKSNSKFIKNGTVFSLLFLIILSLFWITHQSYLESGVIFLINISLFLWLSFFAYRFLLMPFFSSEDEEVVSRSELFSNEESFMDLNLKGGYVNLNNMKESTMNLFNKFKGFYYGTKNLGADINTAISEDILKRESFVEKEKMEDIKEEVMDEKHVEQEETDILEEFDFISQSYKEEKETLKMSAAQIKKDKKEIEESVKFQKEYIESVKEEKDRIALFLQEQKEDLADLLVQKEKEEAELASLAAIETRVAGDLNSERGELKKLLSSSRKELDTINKKRRETIFSIQKNRNEAARKADLIKQIQQRRMALASIKKEKLMALNS